MTTIVLGTGVAILSVTLLIMMMSRWGEARPVAKCVGLSILAHMLLMVYAYSTNMLQPAGPSKGESITVQMITDEQANTREVREWDQADSDFVPDTTMNEFPMPSEFADDDSLIPEATTSRRPLPSKIADSIPLPDEVWDEIDLPDPQIDIDSISESPLRHEEFTDTDHDTTTENDDIVSDVTAPIHGQFVTAARRAANAPPSTTRRSCEIRFPRFPPINRKRCGPWPPMQIRTTTRKQSHPTTTN